MTRGVLDLGEASPGESISIAAERAVEALRKALAAQVQVSVVHFTFNDVVVPVHPGDTVAEVEERREFLRREHAERQAREREERPAGPQVTRTSKVEKDDALTAGDLLAWLYGVPKDCEPFPSVESGSMIGMAAEWEEALDV